MDDDGCCTHLLTNRDLRHWSPLAALPDCRSGAGHYSVVYGHGGHEVRNVVVSVAPSEPAAVRARWGRAWSESATWEAIQAAAVPGRRVLDAFIKPLRSGEEFALVADVCAPDSPGVSRPHIARSSDSVRYEGPLQPLAVNAPAPPRNLRVYGRARNYWLVTYQRAAGGRERLFWGVIDWDGQPPALAKVASTAALEEACYVLGLI